MKGKYKNKKEIKQSERNKIQELNIDQMLYIIKKNKFEINEIKQKLNEKVKFQIILQYKENYALIKLNDKTYEIKPESRMIQFINGKEIIEKFIYSIDSLKETLAELQFKSFIVNDEENLSDSIDSEISDKEFKDIFVNENITKITKIQSDLKNILDKFKIRHNEKINSISDISLNSAEYYSNNKNDKIDLYMIATNYKLEYDLESSHKNIIYFLGPKGTSKSLFLMSSLFKKNQFNKIPSLYINYRHMINLSINKRKNIFKKEMIYLFFDENRLKYFYNEKAYKSIKIKSFMIFLFEFITYLINTYENTFTNKIVTVIDNFDEDNEEEIGNLQHLINLVKNEKNIPKIKLIISGNSKFLYKKLYDYYNNQLDENRELLIYYNLELNKKKDMDSLPLFYFRSLAKKNNNIKDQIIDKELNYCRKFNLYGMYHSLLNNEREILLNSEDKLFDLLPYDYLVFDKKEYNKISIRFHNDIYKLTVKKRISTLISEITLKDFMENWKDRIIQGIFEEKLLTLFISYNKLGLQNLIFCDENRIEIFEINKLKDNCYKKTTQALKFGKPIIITQENFMGKNYDLLLLLPSQFGYIAYFIQIGLNKNKGQIELIKNELTINESKFISGIKELIGYNIVEIKLLFIFDKETQNNSIKNKSFSGAEFCLKNKILFYLFSSKDYKLYSTSDLKNFENVTIFDDSKYIEKVNFSEKLNLDKIIGKEMITLINSKIEPNKIEDYDLKMQGNKTKMLNAQICDINCIYILSNDKNTFLIIRKRYYELLDNNNLEYREKKYMSFDRYYKLLIFSPPQTEVMKKYFRKKKKDE